MLKQHLSDTDVTAFELISLAKDMKDRGFSSTDERKTVLLVWILDLCLTKGGHPLLLYRLFQMG